MSDYHDIFVPRRDVYELGGNAVFHELLRMNNGKNLLVIPDSTIDDLTISKRRGNKGAMNALSFLKEVTARKNRDDDELGARYHLSEGLDVLIVTHEGNQDPVELDRLIQEQYDFSNAHPEFITSEVDEHIASNLAQLRVADPKFLLVSADIVHEGVVAGSDQLLAALYEQDRTLDLEEAVELHGREFYPNQFVRFLNQSDSGPKYLYARVHGEVQRDGFGEIIGIENQSLSLLAEREYQRDIRLNGHRANDVFGISPRDMEQYLALQYSLFNPDVSLSFLTGGHGSGKTLLGYISAIHQVLSFADTDNQPRYNQIVLLKPIDIVGGNRRNIGYQPGDLFEKMRPHLEGYIDAHKESDLKLYFNFEDLLLHPRWANRWGGQRQKRGLIGELGAQLPEHEVIDMTYSGFVRGRSFNKTLVLADEAQNFTPYEMRTIFERVGPGSKVIVMGDPSQRDNPHVSESINGLTHAIKHYLGQPFTSLIHLTRNYRSSVSAHAKTFERYGSGD